MPLTFLYADDFLAGDRDLRTSAAKVIVHAPVSVASDSDADINAAVKAVEAAVMGPVLAQLAAATGGAGDKAGAKEAKKVK